MTEPGSRSSLPDRALAGVVTHFTSLPGPFGIGDVGDAALAFLDTLGTMGMGVWQFLPTGPTAYGDSPYQPLSAFAGNENLVGIQPLIRASLVREEEVQPLRSLPRNHVDYGRLVGARGEALSAAARRFSGAADHESRAQFEEFLHHHGPRWLHDYALFRVLKSAHGERPWPEWEPRFVHRDPAALEAARSEQRAAIERIEVLQFLFHRQWRRLRARAAERGILLFADMPIYIALDSADAWAHPEMLLIDRDGRPSEVAGVPPDYFSADGQLWGNPIYDWPFHERDGFRWWIERLHHAAEMADLVRIDHFRGFEAYWSVPAGDDTARHGSWQPGPGAALFEALRAALGELPIVAEDLGVITPEVTALRKRFRIPGMAVLQFKIPDPAFRLDDIEESCVCYTGTHDNDTTLGWFRGGPGDTRSEQEIHFTRARVLELTGGSPETIHRDVIGLAFSSPARLAMAPLQDYLGLGSEARLNVPGSTAGNWRWRAEAGQLDTAFCQSVREMVTKAGRG